MKSLESSEILMWDHNAGVLTSAATILLHWFDSKQLKFEFKWKQKTWLFRYIGFNHNPNYYPWKKITSKKDYLNLVKDSLITYILFELWLIMIFSPVANFAQQSLLLPFHLILPLFLNYTGKANQRNVMKTKSYPLVFNFTSFCFLLLFEFQATYKLRNKSSVFSGNV